MARFHQNVLIQGDGLPTLSWNGFCHRGNSSSGAVPVTAHISSLRDLRLVVDAVFDDFSHIVPEQILEMFSSK